MENRKTDSSAVPAPAPLQVDSDDYEPPVTTGGPTADDQPVSAPPFDVGDPPPDVPPPLPA